MRRLVFGLAAAAGVLLLASPAQAQSVAGYSEYYIPVDETSLQIAFTDLDAPTTDTLVHTVITVTAWAPNTTVYYDHWENGYGFDPNNPASADETYTLATTGQQQVFESANIPTAPRGTATFYDGGDRIFVAGGTVTVTRASWLEARGPGDQASAWEIYPVKPQLTSYVLPFGENLGFTPFVRVYTTIQATEDNTTVTVDLDGDGTPDPINQNRDGDLNDGAVDDTTLTLNRGQSFLLDRVSACPGGGATCSQANGQILAGTAILGDKTLQVKVVAGNPGQNYSARGFSVFPRGFWTTDYYAPVDQPSTGQNTDYYLHNPHDTAITVAWETRTASGSFTIAANATVSYRTAAGVNVPVDSGIYFSATDDFWGVGVGDSLGAAYEWGYSLLPSTFLYKEHFMGWAPGAYPPDVADADYVGVFVTPAQDNTQFFVDLDNNGVVDQTYTLNRLQTQYIFDPVDGDMSRARIWATGDFTLAYGENPETAPTSNPSIDLGYVGLPGSEFVQQVLAVRKTASPQVVPTASGSVATFTIVATTDLYSLTALTLTDVLPANWQFVDDSATITLPNQTTVSGNSADPQIVGNTLTWNSTFGGLTGMGAHQTTTIVFQAQTTAVLAAGTLSRNDVTASGTRVFYPGTPQQITQTFGASDFTYVASGALQLSKTSNAPTPVYPGDTFAYTITVTNPGGAPAQTGISLFDALPAGLTAVPGSTVLSRSSVADNFGAVAYTNNNGTATWAGAWTETDVSGAAGSASAGFVQVAGSALRFGFVATNVADNFNTTSLTNNTGNTNWAGAWTETSDDGAAGSGTIQIDNGLNRVNFTNGTANRAITRTANVSGGSATISFTLSDQGIDAGETLVAEYDLGLGAGFQLIQTLDGTPTLTGTNPITISTVGATTLTIRFRAPQAWGAGDAAGVDNLNIAFNDAVGSAARRTANLTGATSALLNFDFASANLVGTDTLVVEASTSAAGPFTALATFTGGTPGAQPPYDLTPYISGTTTIRFRVTGGINGATKTFSVDNLGITYDVAVAGPNPPSLLVSSSNYSLAGGQSLTATFNVTVDNPFPTGQTSVTNTAAVTTRGLPVQLTASITDDVEVPTSLTATVAGRIWADADADAVQDLGEPGIANVLVTLKDEFGAPVATTFTDVNGRYLFTGVSPGIGYYVEATAPPDPAGDPLIGLTQSAPVGHTDYRTNPFDLSAGENFTGADQGYGAAAGTVAFGDLAWVDANANGLRDLGEVGLGGVAVRLYRDASAGTVADNFDTNGSYAGNNGSVNWNAAWVEANDGANNATTGAIQVTGNHATVVGGGGATANRSISRTADVTGATSATINFSMTDQGIEGGETMVAEYSIDGGGFVTIGTLDGGTGYSGSALPLTVPLSGNTTLTLRFRAPTAWSNINDIVFIDNVNISLPGNGSLNTLLDTFVPKPTVAPGTLAVTNGSAAVTGTGTSFLSLGAGDPITIGGVQYTILSVASATSLTLTANYTGTTASGLSATVVSTPGAGTVTTNGTTAVVGTGTAFTSLAQGDPIVINGVKYKVQSVTDATNLTLTATAPAGGPLTYGIPVIETTAPDGSYLFPGVTPTGQTYFVASSLPAGYVRTNSQAYTFPNVVGGTSYLIADFGYNSVAPTFSITDRVWNDANADGLFGAEVGFAGVTVELLDGSLNVIGTSITAANGTFTFSGLAGGGADYTTRISDTGGVLTNYFGTTPYALAGQRLEANLAANLDRSAAPSYGFSATRSIGDTVYNDLNGDGTQNGGEPGIAAVVVRLHRDRNTNGVIDLTVGAGTVSLPAGSATVTGVGTTFFNYRAGEPITIGGVAYTILSIASNTSLTLTTTNTGAAVVGGAYSANPLGVGGTGIAVTNGSNVVTGAGTTFTNYAVGDPITIAGVQYTILGIASNTSLTLTTNYTGATTSGITNYSGPPVYMSSLTTDAAGQYLFAGLVNASYLVSVQTLSGYSYIPGARPDVDAGIAGIQLAATIAGGASVLDRDFGFQAVTPRTISGTLWNDVDSDGNIDVAELRLANVTVDILDSNGVVIRTLTTDSSGNYSAAGLAAGTYTVRVTDTLGTLTGYSPTFEVTGGTGGPFNGQESVNVGAADVTNVHFGFRRPVPTLATIARFGARLDGSRVIVEWTTSSEVGTLGFYLYRLNPRSDGWVQVNRAMLPGLINSPQGGSYQYVDQGAQPGAELTYSLREIEPVGWREHGPYRVVPGVRSGAGRMSKSYEARALVPSSKSLKRQREAVQENASFRLRKLAGARQEAVAARRSGAPQRAKLSIRARGLYALDRDTIAGLLGLAPADAANLIRSGQLRLRNQGSAVAWFPAGETMLFYGEPIDSLFTLDNVYWLDARAGRVMPEADGALALPTSDPMTFGDRLHFEQDRFPATLVTQDPTSDYWPWEYAIAGDPSYGTRSFDLPIDGATGDAGTLTVSLLGATESVAGEDHHAVVTLNGTELGEVRWDGLAPTQASFDIPSGVLQDGANSVDVRGVLDSGAPYSVFYVDSFDVDCRRPLRASGNQLLMQAESTGPVTISGFDSDQITVVDVTKPKAARRVARTTIDQAGSFRVSFVAAAGSTYLAVSASAIAQPDGDPVSRSSLAAAAGANYLIIAPGPLVEAARALAEYRSGRGLRAAVVELEDIYDDFNYGIASPEAVRAFLAQAWASKPKPKYVLLAGNGNVDYRNLLGHGDNLMPPLMAPTPFGLFAADNRFLPLTKGGVPRLAIGRLPVLTAAELTATIQKIEAYESAAAGSWQRRVLMVADDFDPNAGDFTAESEAVAGLIPAGYDVTRSYLDAQPANDVRASLIDTFDQGALLVNYVGHGALDRLAAESLLATGDVPALQASSAPPVFAALTCAVGRFDVPGITPLASSLVLDPDGGAIAAWAPTGLSFSSDANVLNQGFASAFFAGEDRVLGHAVQRALAGYAGPGSQRFMLDIYNLLGDPALELRLP